MRFTCQLSYCDDESHGRGHGSVHIRTCYALPNLCLLHMFIWVGGRVQLSKIDLSILLERFPRVLFSTTVRDLGGDPGPGTDPFPACGQCMSLLFLPSAADSFCVRCSLTFKAARTLMHAFICSRVDY